MSKKGGVGERLGDLLRRREEILAGRPEVQLAAVDAEIAAVSAAEAEAAEAERQAALVVARAAVDEAALVVVRAAVELRGALARLDEAEAGVRALGELGATDKVPGMLRDAMRGAWRWWCDWWPELVGAPVHERVVLDIEAQLEADVRRCEAGLRSAAGDERDTARALWRDALTAARERLAKYRGEALPSNGQRGPWSD